jgi:hypothetical protein
VVVLIGPPAVELLLQWVVTLVVYLLLGHQAKKSRRQSAQEVRQLLVLVPKYLHQNLLQVEKLQRCQHK